MTGQPISAAPGPRGWLPHKFLANRGAAAPKAKFMLECLCLKQTKAIRRKRMSRRYVILLILVGLGLMLPAPPASGERGPNVVQLRQAVSQNPQDPEANYKLGMKYLEMGRPRQAGQIPERGRPPQARLSGSPGGPGQIKQRPRHFWRRRHGPRKIDAVAAEKPGIA